MISFLLMIIIFPVYSAINPLIVKESALQNHPSVLAAMEKFRAQNEAIIKAKGSFDTKIISDYKRQTKDVYSNTVSRSFLVKPLPVATSKIYVGSEQISNGSGRFSPVYNTGNPSTTGQPGNYSVLGVQLSLWKNLFLDPNRAALKNAKYDAKIAEAEKMLTELHIERLSQLSYWEWLTAKKIKGVYEELLKNGETRNEFLSARSKRGDIAQIVVTENEQYIASRKGALQLALERSTRSEYALSLFFRDENGAPIIPNPNDEFEDYPSDLTSFLQNLDMNSDIDDLIKKRPDLVSLQLNMQKSEVDLEVARQDLKPQIDVTTEYFQRTEANPNMPRDYLMVMAQVSIPIERNLGQGNIASAQARRMVAQNEMSLGQQAYKAEILSLRKAIQLRLEQVTQAQLEYQKAKELVVSENYKFKTGGGNLFLVNLREQAQASAEETFHEARLNFMDAFLSYKALVTLKN